MSYARKMAKPVPQAPSIAPEQRRAIYQRLLQSARRIEAILNEAHPKHPGGADQLPWLSTEFRDWTQCGEEFGQQLQDNLYRLGLLAGQLRETLSEDKNGGLAEIVRECRQLDQPIFSASTRLRAREISTQTVNGRLQAVHQLLLPLQDIQEAGMELGWLRASTARLRKIAEKSRS